MFYSCAIIYNPETKSVLLHLRDDKAPVNPNRWGLFGGGEEPGERPIQTLIRELKEELDWDVRPEQIVPVRDYENHGHATHRYIFTILSRAETSSFTLNEGADLKWVSLDKVFDYDLTEKAAADLNYFIEHLEKSDLMIEDVKMN
ncbi:MAG TPA: NUDIX domain-containing protein [Patescibacteria group bacterium]|nr:NUDIX domain-containing protein [Patescibacteria group bacterium]